MTNNSILQAVFYCDCPSTNRILLLNGNRHAEQLIGEPLHRHLGRSIGGINLFRQNEKAFHDSINAVQRTTSLAEYPLYLSKSDRYPIVKAIVYQCVGHQVIVEVNFYSNSILSPDLTHITHAAVKPLIDHTVTGFVIIQRNRIVLANPGASKILETNEHEMYSWKSSVFFRILSRKYQSLARSCLQRILEGKRQKTSYICTISMRHGIKKWIDCFACKIRYEGELACIVTINDITAYRKFESLTKGMSQKISTAQKDERRRIAQILHDNSAQNLTVALMRLSSLKEQISKKNHHDMLCETYRLVLKAAEQMRDLSHELDRVAPADSSVIGTFRQMVDQLNRNGTTRYSLINRCEIALNFATDRRMTIISCVGELLVNIARHASAENSIVIVDANESNLHILVKDDGVGFESHDAIAGFGFTQIKNRLDKIDGKIDIHSTPHNGTEIHLNIPLS